MRGERSGSDFCVIGLQNGAALLAPIAVERQDQVLKRKRLVEVVKSGS